MSGQALPSDAPSRAQSGAIVDPAHLGCTGFALRRLSRRVSALYDRALQPCGLKTTQFSMLTALASLGPQPMGSFADFLGMERSTLTRTAAPLLAAGWIRQRPAGAGEADPRAKLLELTPAGRERLAQARPHWRRAQQQVRVLLGDPALLSMHALIDHAMQRLPPGD